MPPDATPRRGLRIALVIIAVIAVAVVVQGIVARSSQAERLRERAEAQSVRTVAIVSPGKAAAAGNLELAGRIEPHARTSIYARVSGYLKAWHADIGAPVKSGQLLAEIETPELDLQLAQARAELASARANASIAETTAKRWQALVATGVVSQQGADEKNAELVAKQSLVAALQANVERYETMKRFARIAAPFDGVVTSRSTDVGALINVGSAQGAELFVIADPRKLRVYVNVPQSYANAMAMGTKATLRVPERPGKTYSATVQATSQSINAASGTMLVQLSAENPGTELIAGGFATVAFQLPAREEKLTIPPSALLFDKAGLRVATVTPEGKVALKPVTVSRDLGNLVEIASGLSPEDRVIESPPDGVVEGEAVRLAQATGGSKPSR